MKRMLLIFLTLLLGFVLVACTDTDTADDAEVEDNSAETSDEEMNTSGITLTVLSSEDTEDAEGVAGSNLILTISMENTTEETVTLELSEDDYAITTPSGLNIVPTNIDDALVNPEIGAGETVTGEVRYATDDSDGTFYLDLGDFDQIEIDATTSD